MNQFVENSLNQVNSKKVSTDMRVLLASLTHPSPPLRKMGGGGKPRARREHQVKWDLKGPQVNRVHERPKVTQDTLLVRCYLYSF